MTTLARRSPSQIQRTFLPGQTADIGGRIYRVDAWPGARALPIDTDAVRRHLIQEVRPFEVHQHDSGFASDLRRGTSLEVVELDTDSGVTVELYPQVWLCRQCKRIGKSLVHPCRCGAMKWGQLHFLGVHRCGNVVEPWIRRCPAHDDVRVELPRSAKATDIRFICPVCHLEIARGLGFVKCSACNDGYITWNVHKARPVFTPRELVMINPPRPERAAKLKAEGGERRALEWVLEGMSALRPESMGTRPGRTEFIAQLVGSGLDPAFAATMADSAEAAGQLRDPELELTGQLPTSVLAQAEHDAFDIAMATAESRIPSTSLGSTTSEPELQRLYASEYTRALASAGLAGADLVEKFPVMSVTYGFTRGGGEADTVTLRPFRGRHTTYRLHGQLAETEALFIRLDPQLVRTWLETRGHDLGLPAGADSRAVRLAILKAAPLPDVGGTVTRAESAGGALVKLVHTYAHRLIRQASVVAGIDRDALSEYLVPRHLGFFLFAASRGGFVLGGLQAVMEQDLHTLLGAMVSAEHRCPLDPGCAFGGSACAACVHLGETSCRRFNTDLDRSVLFGPDGYFTQLARS